MAKKIKKEVSNDYIRRHMNKGMCLAVVSLFDGGDMFTEREKEMIRLFIREEQSLQGIANQYGMSAAGVKVVIGKAMRRMRLHLREQCGVTKPNREDILNAPLKNFQGILGVRIVTRFPYCDINTVGDLINCRPSELHKIRDIGHTSIKKIIAFLKERGLKLQDDPEFYQRYADKYDE